MIWNVRWYHTSLTVNKHSLWQLWNTTPNLYMSTQRIHCPVGVLCLFYYSLSLPLSHFLTVFLFLSFIIPSFSYFHLFLSFPSLHFSVSFSYKAWQPILASITWGWSHAGFKFTLQCWQRDIVASLCYSTLFVAAKLLIVIICWYQLGCLDYWLILDFDHCC